MHTQTIACPRTGHSTWIVHDDRGEAVAIDPQPDQRHELLLQLERQGLSLRWVLETSTDTEPCAPPTPYSDMLADLGLSDDDSILDAVPRIGPVQPWGDAVTLSAGDRLIELRRTSADIPAAANVVDLDAPATLRLEWEAALLRVGSLSILVQPVTATTVTYAIDGTMFPPA